MALNKKWTDMTWQERREQRFEKWLNPPDITFINQEAEEKYRARATRIIKAIQVEEPDRVPCHIPPGSFPAYYAGFDLKAVIYDYEKMKEAYLKFVFDFDTDSAGGAGFAFPGRAYDTLGYKLYKWPGHGLDDTVSMIQFVEDTYMKANEYDAFINNPADFILRYFLPRAWGAFAPMTNLSSLSSFYSVAHQILGAARMPDFRTMFEAIEKANKEIEKWQSIVAECDRITQEVGYPSPEGGMALAPFDTVADLLRGTQGTAMDMYRQPEKLLEAIERIIPLTLQSVKDMSELSVGPTVFIPMHKGDDSFMSDKQFEKFYWPSFRKLLLGIIEEGLVPSMVVDGTYNRRLEYIKDLPKGSVVWVFEKTDMALAKKVLGGHACIGGNVTGSLVCTGTPEDVKKYCRWLIDTCAPGGGYILSMGVSVDKANPDNFHAMVQTAKEYGVYKR
jgi:uroporphyrinogen-III decarboxylase